MKVKKEVLVPAVAEHTKEVEIYVCDCCGREIATSLGNGLSQNGTVCTICGRQVCRRFNDSCARPDPEDYSDYPDSYCPICYDLRFKKYKPQADMIYNTYENSKDSLTEKIKDESLATTYEKGIR